LIFNLPRLVRGGIFSFHQEKNNMKLITAAQRKQLVKNFHATEKDENACNHKPVVKLFNPVGAATWLISEMKDDGDTLFGLCDLGMGCPEFGYVSLAELEAIKGPLGLGIERDAWFEAKMSLTDYYEASGREGRICA